MNGADVLLAVGCVSCISGIAMECIRSDNSWRFGFMSGCLYSGCIVILANVL
jgi:hypothetical protein